MVVKWFIQMAVNCFIRHIVCGDLHFSNAEERQVSLPFLPRDNLLEIVFCRICSPVTSYDNAVINSSVYKCMKHFNVLFTFKNYYSTSQYLFCFLNFFQNLLTTDKSEQKEIKHRQVNIVESKSDIDNFQCRLIYFQIVKKSALITIAIGEYIISKMTNILVKLLIA